MIKKSQFFVSDGKRKSCYDWSENGKPSFSERNSYSTVSTVQIA